MDDCYKRKWQNVCGRYWNISDTTSYNNHLNSFDVNWETFNCSFKVNTKKEVVATHHLQR